MQAIASDNREVSVFNDAFIELSGRIALSAFEPEQYTEQNKTNSQMYSLWIDGLEIGKKKRVHGDEGANQRQPE